MTNHILKRLLKKHPGFEKRLVVASCMNLEEYRRAINKGKPSIDTIIEEAQVMSSTEKLLVAALMSCCDYVWAAQKIAPEFWRLWSLLDKEQTQIVIGLLHKGEQP